MDVFLPQKLQDAAAAAAAARAKAAGPAVKLEPQQERSSAGKADKFKERATAPHSRPSPVASPTRFVNAPVAAPPVSHSYITPMPADIKPAGIKPKRAILQQDQGVNSNGGQVPRNGYKHPIETTDDIGRIEQGMEYLAMGGTDRDGDDDLDAPSSFCCPITTVSALTIACSLLTDTVSVRLQAHKHAAKH